MIIATLFSLMLQGIVSMILPFLSMYLSLAFSQSILLICEKKVPPLQSLLLSLRAVNKKIFVLSGIYLLLVLMFIVGAMFYGIGLIFVLPFFFHVKGILYREMFGITLKIVATEDNGSSDQDGDDNDPTPPSNDDKPSKNPEVFDA
ncbi:probable proline and glycine rich transmembrane protein gene in bax [Vibrio maritimus]|uniref:Probable proline and glycine rich transmembrane protein gene in bax n=1 Tax=Vibrio maritimus TaxID=990268 RepID=A0A090RYD0_9VIBR|nr:probable proline and glycine rich transmembrane protein gene in bax [Vibrio maritimus]